ncbi:MAG: RNA polymerase sigma-54 factor [Armatimonadota bacterium]
MLELCSDLFAAVDQVPAVNCQLIMRSELLELPCLDLVARLQEEAQENPAMELELDPSFEGATASAWSEPAGRGTETEGAAADAVSLAPAPYGLRDELHRRIGWVAAGRQREIAAYLIETIDERGYLTTTLLEAACELGVEVGQVQAALRALQAVAPPGVGARDLRECLLLQLAARPELMGDPERLRRVRLVIGHCHEAMGPGGWPALSRRLGLTPAQLQDALRAIRSHLAPHPGEQFRPAWAGLLSPRLPPPQPDVILHAHGCEIEAQVTTTRAVSLRVAEAYDRLDRRMRALRRRAEDEATRLARAQVRSARQMIWSLQQRERSLHRISVAVARHQHDFIVRGPRHHRPLTHKRVAQLTGLHESTVSRAVMGKLVMLPAGNSVPFSVFFDDALPAKTVLRSLVATEDRGAPHTDEELQALLHEEGFPVARRTVNKYRRVLGIPASGERRRMYQAA